VSGRVKGGDRPPEEQQVPERPRADEQDPHGPAPRR